jgi:hypothetical protein
MEVTYRRPPWLTGSCHPRSQERARQRGREQDERAERAAERATDLAAAAARLDAERAQQAPPHSVTRSHSITQSSI